jgi:hypothetical protein
MSKKAVSVFSHLFLKFSFWISDRTSSFSNLHSLQHIPHISPRPLPSNSSLTNHPIIRHDILLFQIAQCGTTDLFKGMSRFLRFYTSLTLLNRQAKHLPWYDRSTYVVFFVRIFIFYNEVYETAETRVTQHDIKDHHFIILVYMQTNQIHSVLMIELIHKIISALRSFGPYRSIFRSVL